MQCVPLGSLGCAEGYSKIAIQTGYTVNVVLQAKLAWRVIERTPPTTVLVALAQPLEQSFFNVEAKMTLLHFFGHIFLNYSPILKI